MLFVVCVWLYWCVIKFGEMDLLLFVIIIDDLLLEIVEVGYDCCLVLIKLENFDVWLNLELCDFDVVDVILDDKLWIFYVYLKVS